MTTILKYFLVLLISIFFTSCNLIVNGTRGNGNVIIKHRKINTEFSAIKASQGLEVIITEGNPSTVKVQADENLHELIVTEINNGELFIHATKNIGKSSAKKVIVTVTNLEKISSTSGASIYGTNLFQNKKLCLYASSGSTQSFRVKTESLVCNASSGANIAISGTSKSIDAKATSGSVINAQKLKTNTCATNANKGGKIDVYCTNEIYAKANNGGNISYSGNPKQVTTSNAVAGNISKK